MAQDPTNPRSWSTRSPNERLLGTNGILISDFSTLGVICYVAGRLWYETRFPAATWPSVLLVWLLASTGAALGPRLAEGRPYPAVCRFLIQISAAGLCSMVVKALADPFSWRQAGAFGLMFLAAMGLSRLFLGLIARSRATDRWEGLRLGVAQGAALFAVHPYVRSGLLGAGDASSYSMMIADFLEQRRLGIFPILIGQSRFAFSGGFHPIRNAPYLQHLAWFLDLLGLGTLNVFALQNLTVLASMAGGVVGCYAALRISMANGRWQALGLAILYGLCPGVLAPLYGGDMFPTFMTLPFIPWLVLGAERSSASPDRLWPWALQGGALAAMWLAHPPVAAWATLLASVAALPTIIRCRKRMVLGRVILALSVFLALCGYLFVSVGSLGLPRVSRADALASIDFKLEILREAWAGSFLPVSRNASHLLSDIQLGYGLWACLLLSAPGAIRVKSARPLMACFALLLLFAWPIPVLTRFAWRSLPSELLVVTNQWPVERFYVLLAGFAVFIAASALGRQSSRGAPRRLLVGALLLSACAWSAAEARKFFRRAADISHSEVASENQHLPENIVLSRTHSYEYLGRPSHFPDGHMDPRLATRLLDFETRRPFADGSTYRPDSAKADSESRTLVLQEGANGLLGGSVSIKPGEARILRFDFLGQSPQGELQMAGGSLQNVYTLPESGSPKSFGSGPESAHTLILENTTQTAEDVSFRFVARDGGKAGRPFARVSVEPLSEETRVIQLESLTPFHAFVSADRDCYLETPRLFVPGYHATVDGYAAPLERSSDGLVAIPLHSGERDVSLVYAGSRLLTLSYLGSAAAWLVSLAVVGAYALRRETPFGPRVAKVPRSRVGSPPGKRWRPAYALSLSGFAILAVAIGLLLGKGPHPHAGYGAARMVIRLPWPRIGRSEPLVTTGHPGAGDFIYIIYVDGKHVMVGHDKWSHGGQRSLPIAVDYGRPQRVEIALNSLEPDSAGAKGGSDEPGGSPDSGRKWLVKWNGATVLLEDTRAYPSRPSEVTFGENTIGGSSTLSHFSGEILSVTREDPSKPD